LFKVPRKLFGWEIPVIKGRVLVGMRGVAIGERIISNGTREFSSLLLPFGELFLYKQKNKEELLKSRDLMTSDLRINEVH
jgi:hypothetical protein